MKFFNPVLILLMVIALISCNNRPSNVLDEDKMVDLITDMQLAEAYSQYAVKGHRSDKDKFELGQSVLAYHGVTQEQLDTTLGWYGKNVDEYTMLFEKVDKEIIKRKEKLRKLSGIQEDNGEDNLWNSFDHGVINNLSLNDGLLLSIEDPELEKGDRISWSFFLREAKNLQGMMGVEYSDGTSAAVLATPSNKNKFEIVFQTDTAKEVRRIYGSFSVKERKELPLIADSIKVIRIPFDSLDYRGSRGQKKYGVMVGKKPELPKDTIPSDSLANNSMDNNNSGKLVLE